MHNPSEQNGLEKEARTFARSTPAHSLARNSVTLHPLFPMPLSFYFSDFPHSTSLLQGIKLAEVPQKQSPSYCPDSRLCRRMSPFWNCPWPLAWAWSAHLSCLLEKVRPTAIVGIAFVLLHAAAAWCHFAERPELPARLPGRPGILYLLGHPPHLSSASYRVKLKDVSEFWVWCVLLSCCQLWVLTMEKPGSATTL